MTGLSVVGSMSCVGVLNLGLLDAVLLRKALYQLRAQHYRREVSLSDVSVERVDYLIRFCERAIDDVKPSAPASDLEMVG